MRWKIVIAIVSIAALGAVAGALWVGNAVFERTVVADPYETGLHHDAHQRKARELGWRLAVDERGLHTGGQVKLLLALAAKDGSPLDGADVTLRVSRAGKPGLDRTVKATAEGGGRYAALVPLPEAGFWDLDAAVRREGESLAMTGGFRVAPAEGEAGSPVAPTPTPCDVGRAPCSQEVGDLRVTLALSPRPPVPLKELSASVQLARGGQPVNGAEVSVELSMPGMYMGENRIALRPGAAGDLVGTGALVRCASGRRDWIAEVVVRSPGGGETRARFPFQAAE